MCYKVNEQWTCKNNSEYFIYIVNHRKLWSIRNHIRVICNSLWSMYSRTQIIYEASQWFVIHLLQVVSSLATAVQSYLTRHCCTVVSLPTAATNGSLGHCSVCITIWHVLCLLYTAAMKHSHIANSLQRNIIGRLPVHYTKTFPHEYLICIYATGSFAKYITPESLPIRSTHS